MKDIFGAKLPIDAVEDAAVVSDVMDGQELRRIQKAAGTAYIERQEVSEGGRSKSQRGASSRRFTRAGRLSVSILTINRLCLRNALLLRSVTSPSEPNTSKSRLNVSFSSRRQLSTNPAGTIISARVSSPRDASSRRINAVSIVFPNPTESATNR